MISKGKISLYSSRNYIQLQSVVSSITSWKYTVQAVPSKKKKKKLSRREEERKTRWKRGEEEKGMERVCAKEGESDVEEKKKEKKGRMRCGKRRKEGRENEGEGERDERRGRERKTENRESGTRNVPPSPDTFPSTKLGNNMTPIKGRLGKNTTPTSRSLTKLNQNLQVDPRRRRSSFDASSRTNLNHAPKEAEYPKYKLHNNESAI